MDLLETVYVLRKASDTIKTNQAIEYLDSAIYFDSTNYFAYWKKSELLCQLKHYETALSVISSYSNKHRDNMDFLLREAYLYEKTGDTISSNKNYKLILDKINTKLGKVKNKKLMIEKLFLLVLLKEKEARTFLDFMRKEYPEDKEIMDLNEYIDKFNRAQFINYQLTGENEDISVGKSSMSTD
jgi:tetratricopeptide (TPR) repeat protein